MSAAVSGFCEAGAAAVAYRGFVVLGTVHLADPNTGLFAFSPDERDLEPPGQRDTVRIATGADLSVFQAVANVVDSEDAGHWVLSIPRPLAAHESRRAFRHPALGDWVFEVNGRPYDVFDLHSGGVGLIVPPGKVPDDAGQRYAGILRRSDGVFWQVVVESTHLRRHPDYADWQILGCRLHHQELAQRDGLNACLGR